MKQFLSSPPILVRPKAKSPLVLYLFVSDKAIRSVLVQDGDNGERPVYFVSKLLKWADECFQKIENMDLDVVVATRKLKHYFQGHPIIIKTNYLVKQILKKHDLVDRIVS